MRASSFSVHTCLFFLFFFNDPATTEIYTLSLHDALPIARSQGRLLAVVGALLLLADLTVAAALSSWSALTYITSGAEHIEWIKMARDHIAFTTIGVLLIMGLINYFGPKHSGSFAVALALPTAVVVVVLIAISAPHFTTHFLEPRHTSLGAVWVQFVGVILASSGAESIANLSGVVKLDPGSTMAHPV